MESLFETYADYLPAVLAVLVTLSLFAVDQIRRDVLAQREMQRTLHFISDGQYLPATDRDIAAIILGAREHDAFDSANASIQRMRDAHGRVLKLGHLWWLQQQVYGRIPWEAVPPPCTRGKQGLGDHPLSKSLPLNL